MKTAKSKIKKYFSLFQTSKEVADVYIFGDITSWKWLESDVSSYTLVKQLSELSEETKEVNVHINSYGGEVSEGIAIYNTLLSLKKKGVSVNTYCDGFACSIASVIFMAGTKRIMSNSSILMIHNAWMNASGNAKQLRKTANDLEKINETSKKAYLANIKITEEELQELLNEETILSSEEAIEKGFATEKDEEEVVENTVNQSALSYITSELLTKSNFKHLIIQKVDKIIIDGVEYLPVEDETDDDEENIEELLDNKDKKEEQKISEKAIQNFLNIIGG